MTVHSLAQSPQFEKHLRKLDRQVQRRILVALYELVELPEPTVRLKPLQHSKAGLWRLRVGDYRVILDVRQDAVTVTAIDVGPRADVDS